MTPRLHLYELIRSMTRAEVVAFREHATKRRKNSKVKYLQLFDAIRGMATYDESILREKFKGEGFMNNLSHYKAYLYYNILDSLREAQKSDSTRLHAYLEQIIILKDKGFYHHTHSLFKKAFELARQIEDFPNHLKLIELKQEIAFSRSPDKDFADDFAALREEELKIRTYHENLSEYRHLLGKIYPAFLYPMEDRLKLKEEIESHPLMQSPESCLSVRSQVLFYYIQFTLKAILHRILEGKAASETIISIYEANPSLLILQTELVRFLNACYNLGLIHTYENNLEGTKAVIQKLEGFGKSHKSAPILLFERIYLLKMYSAYFNLDPTKGLAVVEEIKSKLQQYGGRVHRKKEIEFEYTIAVYFLCIDQPKKAIRWLNKIKNDPVPPFRKDLHFNAWILFLFAHIDLGNWEVVERALTPTKNYFQKSDNLEKLQKKLLAFFHAYIRSTDRKQQHDILTKLAKDLEEDLNTTSAKQIMQLFNIQAWIKAKQEGTLLSQALKST